MDSRLFVRAEGATYATVNLIPPLCMQLILKPMKGLGTVNVTTSTIDVTQPGKKSEQSMTISDANIFEQSEIMS